MTHDRVVGVVTIVAGVTALVSNALLVWMVGGDFAILEDPAALLRLGADGAAIYHWSAIADMLGFYLLMIPLAVLLGQRLYPRAPELSVLAAVCGVVYATVGAIGAAALAALVPYLAGVADQPGTAVLLGSGMAAVVSGLFDSCETIAGGAWWLIVGGLLWRERRGIAGFAIVVGAIALVDAFGTIAGIPALGLTGVGGLWVALEPFWAVWIGVALAAGWRAGAD